MPDAAADGGFDRSDEGPLLRVRVVSRDGARCDRLAVAVQILEIDGEVDVSTVDLLTALLADALTRALVSRGRRLVIDAGGMAFCGLGGLRVLMCASRFATEFGILVAYTGLAPRLARLIPTLWPDVAAPTVYRDRITAIVAIGLGAPWPGPSRPERPAPRGPDTLPV